MKIRSKFMLAFLLTVSLTVCGLSYYISTIMTQNVLEEKNRTYDRYLQQLSINVSLLTNETEQAFYNQYLLLNVANLVQSSQLLATKKANIENTLVSIPLNISNISSVLIEDEEGNTYFASTVLGEKATCFDQVLQTEDIHDTFTLWLRDDTGRLFLKKDLYRLYPLAYTGIILAQIDENVFRSSLGFDGSGDAITAIYTCQGKLFLSDGENTSLVLPLETDVSKFSDSLSQKIEIENEEYWMIAHPSADRQWSVIMLIPMQVMLSAPLALSRILWFGTFAILAIAVLLSFLTTWKLGKNVQTLLHSMKEVSQGRFDTKIEIKSRDEIGLLADRFRWMTHELDLLTKAEIKRATEKQKAEYEMLELRYRSLQAQISPHFICNVLTTIDALALMGKSDEVSKMSISASKYLRENLRNIDTRFHSLFDEIRFVNDYVEVYRRLYQNGFEFTVQVEDNVPDCLVPTMLLQPLVENALVHGYLANLSEDGSKIQVLIGTEENQLLIRVKNNGEAIPAEVLENVRRAGIDHEYTKKMKGFGLRSVLQRLYLLYGNEQSMTMNNLPEGGTEIMIQFPLESMELMNG